MKKQHVCVFIFFLVYLSLGISIYEDYGIPWDEPTHRVIAGVSVKYIASIFHPGFKYDEFTDLPALAEYPAKHYGVIFDLPMYVADMLFGYDGRTPDAYYLRHLCTFLLFYVSVFFFYLIVRNRFESPLLGLTACLFLILSPRIFAQSFYGKDVVFLSLFIISIYFFVRYLNRKTIANALLFALATALVVGQRITGTFIPFLALFMTSVDLMKADRRFENLHKRSSTLFIYLMSFALFLVIIWPYLWENPLRNFIDAFGVMNRFPISYYNLYWGKFIKSTEIPWHYIPAWILITTPIIYTFFFTLGTFWSIKGIFGNGFNLYTDSKERQDFLFLLLFSVPLSAVILLDSALYDGWRHMYFIYAPFLLIVMKGLDRTLNLVQKTQTAREKIAGFFIMLVIAASLISTAYQMIRHHPYQNVYFNCLAGNDINQKFDLDYWGLSFRKGLEYLSKNDSRPAIGVSANVYAPMFNNLLLIDKKDSERIKPINIRQADYFITNYRWHPQPYPFDNEVFSVSLDNMRILSVFKLQ